MDIKEKDIKAFVKHAEALDRLTRRIQRYCPEANLFLEEDTLHLMKGLSHNIKGDQQQENIVKSVMIISGGGWKDELGKHY